MSECQSNGSLVFYFPGHGLQQLEQQKCLDIRLCQVQICSLQNNQQTWKH